MQNELWLPVVGYEGLYEVSSFGKVRSLDKVVHNGRGFYIKKGVIRKEGKCHDGYIHVILRKDLLDKTLRVHRIVASAFVPNPDGKKEVNHKNGIKNDNRMDNLEWVTPSENMKHSHRFIGRDLSNLTGERNHMSRKVIDVNTGMVFGCVREASDYYGINYKALYSRIRRGSKTIKFL